MKQFFDVKNMVIAGFTGLMLFNLGKILYLIATQISIDGASGFLLGLLAMLALIIQNKLLRFLCKVAREWLDEQEL